MEKGKEAAKCFGVILGYVVLVTLSKLSEFWIFMAHQTRQDLQEEAWSWVSMPESRFFYAPGGTGLLCVAVTAIVLCMVIHGKDFRRKTGKEIQKTFVTNWKKLLTQELLIIGVALGMSYTRILDRIASVLSMKEIYYYLNGTTPLRESTLLDAVAERFSVTVAFHETDLWMLPVAFLIYELLRICFDSRQ